MPAIRPPTQWVAFLRGINVGGRQIRMNILCHAFEEMGFTRVRTLLASGNVLFQAPTRSRAALQKQIEAGLETAFGITILVVLRRLAELEALAALDPFKEIRVTTSTRLYVTFLRDRWKGMPPEVPTSVDFRILRASPAEVVTVLTLSDKGSSLDVMAALEQAYGKTVTTRNWNTVQRALQAAGESMKNSNSGTTKHERK